jgi:hypothetical protein
MREAMKRIYFFLLVAVMVGAPAFSAQAFTINDDSAETHLYQIVADPAFGGLTGFASSQDFANAYPILESLPARTGDVAYYVTAYANFASFTQDPGTYLTASPDTMVKFGVPFPAGVDGIFAIAPIEFQVAGNLGFFDETNNGVVNYIQSVAGPGNSGKSGGLIFQIADNHYIVAFEDGGWGPPWDSDYNDLVLNVTTSHAPLPSTLLLMSSSLLGLIALKRYKKI